MPKLNFAHLSDKAIKAYDWAVARATERAASAPGECYSVYYDGAHSFAVQNSAAAPPKTWSLVCIAQRWDAQRVQLRFTGAYSEWRNV